MDFLKVTDIFALTEDEIWDSLSPTQKMHMLEVYQTEYQFVDKYKEGVRKGNGKQYFSPSSFVKQIFDTE